MTATIIYTDGRTLPDLSIRLWMMPYYTEMSFAGSLNDLSNYIQDAGSVAHGRFIVLLSEVEVLTPEGTPIRFVAFVSKSGLPSSLEQQLTDRGYTIYEADQFEGHAEIAAQNYRADTEAQVEDLGVR